MRKQLPNSNTVLVLRPLYGNGCLRFFLRLLQREKSYCLQFLFEGQLKKYNKVTSSVYGTRALNSAVCFDLRTLGMHAMHA